MRIDKSAIAGLLVVAVFSGNSSIAFSKQPNQKAAPVKSADWQTQARKLGLTDAEIAFLAENKILMTRNCYKQIFDPYTGTDLPVFITVDSVLNAFHVLLESSFVGLERVQARRLRVFVQAIWNDLPSAYSHLTGKEQLVKNARRRATIVIAVALRLLGEATPGIDPRSAEIVESEIRKIEEGTETKKPDWLGPPDAGFAGLDYARFRPRGFYVNIAPLERYFRALTWLQAIPFRSDRTEELLAHALIHGCYERYRHGNQESSVGKQINEMFAVRNKLLSAESFQTSAARPYQDWKTIDELLNADRRTFSEPVNDQIVAPELNPGVKIPEPSRRILSSAFSPESALFTATTNGRRMNRPFPKGLEVAGMLGSAFAVNLLLESEPKEVSELVKDHQKVFWSSRRRSRILSDYFQLLTHYLDRKNDPLSNSSANTAWNRKRLNTVLGGWAQMRHTFAAHITQSYTVCNGSAIEPGFIEPAPRFFMTLADLAVAAFQVFDENDALFDDISDQAQQLEQDALVADRIVAQTYAKFLKAEFPNRDKWFRMMQSVGRSQSIANRVLATKKSENWDDPDFWKDEPRRLREAAAMMKAGNDPRLSALRSKQGSKEWIELIGLCFRLEILLQKQIRNEAFDEGERYFVREFGRKLASTMFYGLDAYVTPRDDAPRIIDVHTNPEEGRLMVGVERPREILVLYTFAGKEFLCRGAVMPYCEFVGPNPITDSEFVKLLDSPNRPKPPDWLVPLFGPSGPRTPVMKKTH